MKSPTTLRSARLAGLSLSESGNSSSEWVFAALDGAYATRGATDKGLGGFAVRKHQHGERILAELPLLQWVVDAGKPVLRAALEQTVNDMDNHARARYFALMQSRMYGEEKNACAAPVPRIRQRARRIATSPAACKPSDRLRVRRGHLAEQCIPVHWARSAG